GAVHLSRGSQRAGGDRTGRDRDVVVAPFEAADPRAAVREILAGDARRGGVLAHPGDALGPSAARRARARRDAAPVVTLGALGAALGMAFAGLLRLEPTAARAPHLVDEARRPNHAASIAGALRAAEPEHAHEAIRALLRALAARPLGRRRIVPATAGRGGGEDERGSHDEPARAHQRSVNVRRSVRITRPDASSTRISKGRVRRPRNW